MDRGLYTAASGMIAGVSRQEAIMHNLANMRTTGYKADDLVLKDFPSLLLAQVRGDKTVGEVGTLGTGVSTAELLTNFETGPVNLTDNPMDFAIASDGFFQLQTDEGLRYTRDGRFHIDGDGRLVSADGYPVQGADGDITLPNGDMVVSPTGSIFVNDEVVAQINLATFDDKTALSKQSQTLFSADDGAAQIADPANVQIYQGYLEDSNVDVTKMITEMTTVMRAYQLSQQMVQFQDRVNSQAASEIGRV